MYIKKIIGIILMLVFITSIYKVKPLANVEIKIYGGDNEVNVYKNGIIESETTYIDNNNESKELPKTEPKKTELPLSKNDPIELNNKEQENKESSSIYDKVLSGTIIFVVSTIVLGVLILGPLSRYIERVVSISKEGNGNGTQEYNENKGKKVKLKGKLKNLSGSKDEEMNKILLDIETTISIIDKVLNESDKNSLRQDASKIDYYYIPFVEKMYNEAKKLENIDSQESKKIRSEILESLNKVSKGLEILLSNIVSQDASKTRIEMELLDTLLKEHNMGN